MKKILPILLLLGCTVNKNDFKRYNHVYILRLEPNISIYVDTIFVNNEQTYYHTLSGKKIYVKTQRCQIEQIK